MQPQRKYRVLCRFPQRTPPRELFDAGPRRMRLRECDPRPWNHSRPSYTLDWRCLTVDRIRYHDPLSISSNSIAKLKKGSGVGRRTHPSDWDSGDEAAEKIKLQ